MTFTVTVAVATTTISIPGTAPAAADYRARLLAADGTPYAEVSGPDASFVFKGVPSGEYTAEVARLDAAGGVIGSPVTQSFGTGPDAAPQPAPAPVADITVTVPSTLSITAAQE